MKKLFIIIAFSLISQCLFSQSVHNKLPVNETLNEGQEIEVLLSAEISRVNVLLQNVIDDESVVYRTMYKGNEEIPENKIGPKEYRTVELAPKIEDESEPIRLDKKELVIIIGDSDKLFIKVEKGKVNIQVKPSEK